MISIPIKVVKRVSKRFVLLSHFPLIKDAMPKVIFAFVSLLLEK